MPQPSSCSTISFPLRRALPQQSMTVEEVESLTAGCPPPATITWACCWRERPWEDAARSGCATQPAARRWRRSGPNALGRLSQLHQPIQSPPAWHRSMPAGKWTTAGTLPWRVDPCGPPSEARTFLKQSVGGSGLRWQSACLRQANFLQNRSVAILPIGQGWNRMD